MTKAVSSYRYETKRSDEPLRTRLNHKRVHRVYRGAGLMIRRKKRKHCVRVGQPLRVWTATNQEGRAMQWSVDGRSGGKSGTAWLPKLLRSILPLLSVMKQRDFASPCVFDGDPSGCYHRSAGWSSLVARWAHNPKVGGSNPPPATNQINYFQDILRFHYSRRSLAIGVPATKQQHLHRRSPMNLYTRCRRLESCSLGSNPRIVE